MPAHRLNEKLLAKMSDRLGGKPVQYIREQISKRASRQNMSSAAAQLLWAKELGIGIATALVQSLPDVRHEVRTAAAARPAQAPPRQLPRVTRKMPSAINDRVIRALIQDNELYARCRDLLRARRHFDRVIREATTLLDDRLKRKTAIEKLSPENLVNKAIHHDPSKAIIEVSSNSAEQTGFHHICNGIMLAFRNKAHHSLSEAFTREDALKFCGFVDTILATIEKSAIHKDRL
jgi:hypothetical protein